MKFTNKEKFRWIQIQSDSVIGGSANTKIARVPGGWVLKHFESNNDLQTECESMVFIPTPEHEWEFEEV